MIKRRDIEDTVWQVLTSFGFSEEDAFCEKDRYFVLDKKEAAIVTKSNAKARADAVAACIETAFAVGADEFFVTVSDKAVFNLLDLFGFIKILRFDENGKDEFVLLSNGTDFARGNFTDTKTIARIDIEKLIKASENSEIFSHEPVSKSLVFAEKDAEGVAYDICYNLRVNGCIVEMYSWDGDINVATEYAEKEDASAIIRCFKDGCIEIKDISKNEIIKTTREDFLGYYEDDCEHHDGDCDCGHHHH
ncbi:MAG: hypothetical protein IJR79_00565 [Clostridia bacterium]|nr:hypothetical protein [Clostridia bacterium]MBQ7751450.1 hypothetical protein [Clostridia bacterium]